MRGRGVPAAGHGTKPGDLLVKVDVAVPDDLTDEQRAAVEALAATPRRRARRGRSRSRRRRGRDVSAPEERRGLRRRGDHERATPSGRST